VAVSRCCGTGCSCGYGQFANIASQGPVTVSYTTSYECAPSGASGPATGAFHFDREGAVTANYNNVSNSYVRSQGKGSALFWECSTSNKAEWNYGTFNANQGPTLIAADRWQNLYHQSCLFISNPVTSALLQCVRGTPSFHVVQCLFKGHGTLSGMTVLYGGYCYVSNCQFDGNLPNGMTDNDGNILQKYWRYSVTRTNSETARNCAFLKTVPTSAFTGSNALMQTFNFNESDSFSETASFTGTKLFLQTALGAETFYLVESSPLPETFALPESEKLFKTIIVTKTKSWEETNNFTKTGVISESNEVLFSVNFSESISFKTTSDFNYTAKVTVSSNFSTSVLISNSRSFNQTCMFNHTEIFPTKSEDSSPSSVSFSDCNFTSDSLPEVDSDSEFISSSVSNFVENVSEFTGLLSSSIPSFSSNVQHSSMNLIQATSLQEIDPASTQEMKQYSTEANNLTHTNEVVGEKRINSRKESWMGWIVAICLAMLVEVIGYGRLLHLEYKHTYCKHPKTDKSQESIGNGADKLSTGKDPKFENSLQDSTIRNGRAQEENRITILSFEDFMREVNGANDNNKT
jgi:hypothetical protein